MGLSDKNPVSALLELCTKLKWEKPVFEIHEQNVSTPEPKFLMKVMYDCFTFSHNHFVGFRHTFCYNSCYFDESNNLIKYHDSELKMLLVGLFTRDMKCIVFCNFLDIYSLL